MNKKNLALLISKHPLLRKLTEDKTIPNSVIARLIVEELTEQDQDQYKGQVEKLNNLIYKDNKFDNFSSMVDSFLRAKLQPDNTQNFATVMGKMSPEALLEVLGDKDEWFKEKKVQIEKEVKDGKLDYAAFLLMNEFEKWKAQYKEAYEAYNKATGDSESGEPDKESYNKFAETVLVWQDMFKSAKQIIQASQDAEDSGPNKSIEHLKKVLANISKNLARWNAAKFLKIAEKADPQFKEITLNSVKELGPDPEEAAKKASVEKPKQEVPTKQWLELYRLLGGQEQPSGKDPSAKMIAAMEKINKLATNKKDIYWSVDGGFTQVFEVAYLPKGSEEANNGTTTKPLAQYNISQENLQIGDIGSVLIVTSEQLYKVEKVVQEQEESKKITTSIPVENVKQLNALFSGTEDEEGMPSAAGAFFVHSDQEKMVPLKIKQEPDKEEKPSTPMKGEPVAIDPAQAGAFVSAANELLNDFYNQKYRKNQAIIVGNVINSMKAFVEDADLALAFGKPPADKPEEQEATSEEPPKEQEATSEEPAPLEEQEGEEVKADKDEMRNIRIGLRSFLSRVNKTNKYLAEFEKVAADGSVLSDAYKKKFMDNLKEIQTAIYRLALVLNKMLDSKEELNEKKESETINKWKEVQKLYDLSIKSVSSVKELLDTETPPDELDSTLTNDAYTALIDLAGHFPSVAPFGAGKMKRSDFGEYKTKFANAIGQVKSDLQNVFNLIKTGEAGEESLQNARGGLRDFGDAIASIFGVPSKFKDAKVKPGDDKAPAVQEDPEAEKEPEEEEEKYSDEISEEDKEILSLALKQDEKFYQKALKIIKSSQDPNSGSIQLQEVMKKTEDLIRELKTRKIMAKQQIKRIKGGNIEPDSMEKLVKTLREYVSLYEKIQDSIRSGDMSSILDTNPVRVEKVQKLIDRSKRYLDEKAAINNLFVAVINDAFGDDKNLELIWDALKDADGKEAARLTSDMKGKIARAGKNIKNTILKSFEPEKLDFSSFKKFAGMVADKISKTAIQLDKKINEEEDIEIPATQDDIKRAEKEKADERDAPFKEKELKTYQKNFGTALQEMKSFVALYNAFDYAMDQIEKEVGRTKFLEAFDKDYPTVLAQLGIMDDHLKKVAKMFGEGTPSLTVAEKYGFPPEGFKPKPEDPEEKINSILKKQFKLEKLQKESGMSDEQVSLYARLLVELDKDGIVKLEEQKRGQAFVNNVKKVMKSKFEKDEDILAILKLDGVLAHLRSVYIGDAVEVEGDPDDTPDKSKKPEKEKKKPPTQDDMQKSYYQQDRLYREQLIADKLKPLIKEMLTKGK
jgi:hypothetical protein